MGAVTMKIMSKTSITSMYGTTLMSDICFLCFLAIKLPFKTRASAAQNQSQLSAGSVGVKKKPRSGLGVHHTVQDAGELFRKGFVLGDQFVGVRRETVIGNHGGNRGE